MLDSMLQHDIEASLASNTEQLTQYRGSLSTSAYISCSSKVQTHNVKTFGNGKTNTSQVTKSKCGFQSVTRGCLTSCLVDTLDYKVILDGATSPRC